MKHTRRRNNREAATRKRYSTLPDTLEDIERGPVRQQSLLPEPFDHSQAARFARLTNAKEPPC
ncbi:MAG: hypothetical protein WCJ35_24260 [Planctomycetota bacterium]